MSPIDPSRHFAALQQFGRFWSEADISERLTEGIGAITAATIAPSQPISPPETPKDKMLDSISSRRVRQNSSTAPARFAVRVEIEAVIDAALQRLFQDEIESLEFRRGGADVRCLRRLPTAL